MTRERIVDLVYSRPQVGMLQRGILAFGVAAAFYGTAVAAVIRTEDYLSEWSVLIAGRVGESLDRVHVITPPAPKPVEPKPKPEAPKMDGKAEEDSSPQRAVTPQRGPAQPPAYAQAGQVLAQEPDPSQPADLTGNTFETGLGKTYGGGYTKSSGTSTHAVDKPIEPKKRVSSKRSTVDLSSPVGLPSASWSCPWPVEADGESTNEQTAIIQVQVRPDGSVETARVLVDPGLGFGQAAVRCARASRFVPARDRDGRPVSSLSLPIRVWFRR